jgi:predicted MPP superfamily phosphohydrolase
MQIVSDLHLEFYKPHELLEKVKLKPNAEYLVLAGDICVCGTNDIVNLEKFLDYYSSKYKLIFWLAGNHEFYSGKKLYRSIDDILDRCKKLSKKYSNVVFLNNKHYDITINGTEFSLS